MTRGVILFSGGLDSVMLALLLKREGYNLQPVYMSHRANVGNVTKKELKAASKLARSILGKELLIVKARAKGKEPAWYQKYGEVSFSDRLPVEKSNKDQRNRVFLRVLKDLDLAGGVVAIGLFDSEATPKNRKRWADIRTPDLERFFTKLRTGGDLLTLTGLGHEDKVEALEALGRRGKIPAQLWSSESCLMYFNKPCGDCASCKARAEAFLAAWGQDKTPYRPKSVAGKMKRKARSRKNDTLSFEERTSPLDYQGYVAQRLELCNSVVTEQREGDHYFAGADPCVVAFVDFLTMHPGTDYESYKIFFIAVRSDMRRRRYGGKTIEEFYRRYGGKVGPSGLIDWGSLYHEGSERLFQRMKEEHPDIFHRGHIVLRRGR